MTLFESFFAALCVGTILGIIRFSLLAFAPDHPVSRVLARFDRA
ncbi:hypothetical protein SAMN04488095_2266 [Jannaschia pohangensis]|uniref:Uncharacterized protein n=1 Tax=Jannaschia pohangensis TaxID=390807 RepID=A0A1I3NWS4_9RHOB|nr:hypothetical protein SAMN04488095_2266 [Jannaschia pohangensis]